ncbi:MAG: hypothetical protein QM756_20250 [Polyangiaceae bacterium]
MVATIALYWFTGTIGSASALYARPRAIRCPSRSSRSVTAVLHSAAANGDHFRVWVERHDAIAQWTTHDPRRHHAAIEVPYLFVEDVRTFARLLCAAGKAG